jgi:Domain of unknown function (DUF4202)
MPNKRCQEAIELIDEANSEDPNTETWEGVEYPRELLYGRRMTAWLERLQPEPSDLQYIAARGQHIRRWTVPRNRYPMTRVGYLQWRTGLYDFHAKQVGKIMVQAGYEPDAIEQVRRILRKRGLKKDPDVQLIEDVACLVFIENYFLDFAKEYEEEKVLSVIRKTWKKMSPHAQQAALDIALPERAAGLIRKALEG